MEPEKSTPASDVAEQLTTVEDWKRRDLKRHTVRLVADLQDIAARIERLAGDFDLIGTGGRDTYASIVGNMQQVLLNGLTNAGTGMLIQDAGEADHARGAGQ